MATSTSLPILLVLAPLAVIELIAASSVDVGAIYYGAWHVDPQMSALHGPNWTEWHVVVNAQPRFPGHLQPNLPMHSPPGFGQDADESDPTVMAAKIDAATENGISWFLFDWYWYATPTGPYMPKTQTSKGGVFMGGALEKGFMKAKNTNKMKFALMWANQDWVDIHPAKRGWHGTYRRPDFEDPEMENYYANKSSIHQPNPPAGVQELLLFDGFMSCDVYKNAFDYIARTYFTQPNYKKLKTKLPNGTEAECCMFSFYQAEVLAAKQACGAGALDAIAYFRQAAEDNGQCLHLNLMGSPETMISKWNVSSVTDYGWMKTVHVKDFPSAKYEDIITGGVQAWKDKTAQLAKMGVPYIPSMSVQWDSSPRTLIHDPFGQWGYPWGVSWRSNASQFTTALNAAKDYMNDRCSGDAFCPPLLINAWNEWSESSYLEPDQREGFAKLKAIGSVFPPSASN